MPLPIPLALTKAGNQTLTVAEVMTVIADSEGKSSDANNAKGHPLQHVQETSAYRKTAYSEKRPWNEIAGSGSHTCFKTEKQQAELVRDALCSNDGKTALRRLNSGEKSVKIKCSMGSGETVISQGSLGGEFGVFCDDRPAAGVVVEVHVSGGNLHIRSAYPFT